MEQKQLYVISETDTGTPLLERDGRVALICDDERIATLTVRIYAQKYPNRSIGVTPILNPAMFFRQMSNSNVTQFMLNGGGMLLGASDFGIPEPEEAPKPKQKPARPKKEKPSKEEKQKKKWAAKSVRQRRRSYRSKRVPFGTIVVLGAIFLALIGFLAGNDQEKEIPTQNTIPRQEIDLEKINEIINETNETIKEINEKYGSGSLPQSGEETEQESVSVPSPPLPSGVEVQYDPKLNRYTTDVPYFKGGASGNVYLSAFTRLSALVPAGYTWMTSDEMNTLLQNDSYQLDWEVAVRGKTDRDRLVGLFTVAVDPQIDFEGALAVLKATNKDYLLDESSTGSTVWFTNQGLKDPNFKKLRKYNGVTFNGPARETREIAFLLLGDRLVCVLDQYGKDAPEENLSIFLEVVE